MDLFPSFYTDRLYMAPFRVPVLGGGSAVSNLGCISSGLLYSTCSYSINLYIIGSHHAVSSYIGLKIATRG